MDDLFKRMGMIFNPEPLQELDEICQQANIKEKPKTFEEFIDEERPTLYETFALKCLKAVEWGIERFVFSHEGTFYLVEWKKKGTAFEFWSDPQEIEKL